MNARLSEVQGITAERAVTPAKRGALSVPYRIRSDEDLVALAQAGNTQAFDELVARYRDRIYTLAIVSLGNEDQAGDVVCEAFVSAFRGIGSIGKRCCSARTWFYLHAMRALFARLDPGRNEYTLERRVPA